MRFCKLAIWSQISKTEAEQFENNMTNKTQQDILHTPVLQHNQKKKKYIFSYKEMKIYIISS